MEPTWTVLAKPNILKNWTFLKTGQVLPDICSATTIDYFPVTATWVDVSEFAANFKSFTDLDLVVQWCESHPYIWKYLLQITKSRNNAFRKPALTSMQKVLGGYLLPTLLILYKGPWFTES